MEGKRRTKRGTRGGRNKKRKDDDDDVIATGANAAPLGGGEAATTRVLDEETATWVDGATGNYLKGVEDELDKIVVNREGDWEERARLLGKNVMKEISLEICRVSRDAVMSRILEKVIWVISEDEIVKAMKMIKGRWASMAIDQYASHMLQTIFEAGNRKAKVGGGYEEEVRTAWEEIGHAAKNVIVCRYGAHVVSTLIRVLCGKSLAKERGWKGSKSYRDKVLIGYYRDIFDVGEADARAAFGEIGEAIMGVVRGRVEILAKDVNATMVLQALLDVEESANEIIEEIIGVGNETCVDFGDAKFKYEFYTLTFHETGSRFVEKVIEVASDDLLHMLYMKYFRGKLDEIALDKIANYPLQTFLRRLRNSVQFEVVAQELIPVTCKLVECKNLGVISTIFELCRIYRVAQKEFCSEFLKLFASPPINLIRSILSGSPGKFNIHSSLIIQHMLRFDNPKEISTAVLDLNPDDARILSCDQTASHVIETFFSSTTVSIKKKHKAIRTVFSDICIDIATDKYGSHVFEKLWIYSPISSRKTLARSLFLAKDKLIASVYGNIVYKKLKICALESDAKSWVSAQTALLEKTVKIRDIFESSTCTDVRKRVDTVDPLWSKHLFDKDLFKWDARDDEKISSLQHLVKL